MADQQDLLTAEPDLSGIVPGGEPGLAEAMPSPAMDLGGQAPPEAGPGDMDLDQLLASIEATETAPPPEEPTSVASDIASMMDRIQNRRQAVETEDGTTDVLASRLQEIEGNVQRLKQEKEMLAAQNVRDAIQSTISSSISDQMQKLDLDVTKGPGKAFTRIVSNSAMVAVAREQARTGNPDIDLKSVHQTVNNYSKLIVRVATEIAAKMQANKRLGLGGAQKQPFTPSKAPGEMSEDEFDSAVIAAMKAFGS